MYILAAQSLLFIIFIIILSLTFIILTLLVVQVLRLIEIRRQLKAKQFENFNTFAKENQIVFLGDSLTDFYQIEEFFHGYQAYNRGIASDTTDGVLKRLDANVIQIKPSKVFLQIGTNDFKKRDNDYILNNIIKIIETVKSNVDDVKVYLISLYPVNTKAKLYSRLFTWTRNNKTIVELNQRLENYCNENQITYIDIHSKLVDEKGDLDKQYTIEGLHINYEGYYIITEALLPYVRE